MDLTLLSDFRCPDDNQPNQRLANTLLRALWMALARHHIN